MQLHQGFKEELVLSGALPQQGQTGVQSFQQAGNHGNQLGRLLERNGALDAPQQVRHHRAKALRVYLVALVHQPGVGHGQSPRAKQEVQHHAGHVVQVRAGAQIKCYLVSPLLPFFCKAQGLHHTAPVLRGLLVLLVPGVLQRGQRQGERFGVVDGQCVEFIEGLRDGLEETGKFSTVFVVVLEAALGHTLHQPPPGMTLVTEKARVHHCQPQQ